MMCERALSRETQGECCRQADGAADIADVVHRSSRCSGCWCCTPRGRSTRSTTTSAAQGHRHHQVLTPKVLKDIVCRGDAPPRRARRVERDAVRRACGRGRRHGDRRRPDRGAQGHRRQASAQGYKPSTGLWPTEFLPPRRGGPAGCRRALRRPRSSRSASDERRRAAIHGSRGRAAQAAQKIDRAGRPGAARAWMDEQRPARRGLAARGRFVIGRRVERDLRASRAASSAWRCAARRAWCRKGRNETMLREYRVLAALNDTDVPHPTALGVCDDASVLGACFYLMDFVDGWSCMANPGNWPAPFDDDLEARKGSRSSSSTASRSSRNVDWQARGLEGFGKPEGFHERQVDRWLAHLDGVQVPRAARHRRRGRVAAQPQAALVQARDHPRRLPVRERDVPPRRAGAAGGDRRLGDGDDRRPAARPRLGRDGLARTRRGPTPAGLRRLHGMPTARSCSSTTRTRAGCRSTRSTTTSSSAASRWRSCSRAATRGCSAAPTTRRCRFRRRRDAWPPRPASWRGIPLRSR